MVYSFAALDFETANRQQHSICAMGVVIIEANTVRKRLWLVRPPGNRYAPENTDLHGLAASDTRAAKSFAETWPEAKEMIGSRPVIGHNMEWDAEVLKASLDYYNRPTPRLQKGCSLNMAILVWPDRTDYTLPGLCSDLGISLDHHNALSDARAVAELVIMMTKIEQCDLLDLIKRSRRGASERRQEALFRAMKGKSPTDKQLGFLENLLSEEGHSSLLINLVLEIVKEEWDRLDVSRAIDAVKSGKGITITRPTRKELKTLTGTRFSTISRGNRSSITFTIKH